MSIKLSCPTCLSLIRANSEQCPHCGQEFCPECALPLPPNALKCAGCDTEFGVYCTVCDEEVSADATSCPYCGESLEEKASIMPQPDTILNEDEATSKTTLFTQEGVVEAQEETAVSAAKSIRTCPTCNNDTLLLTDTFCAICGTLFCGQCHLVVSEEDDTCPHCQTALYFDCTTCNFELTTGTDICPNCNTLFPAYCHRCGKGVTHDGTKCPHCFAPIFIEEVRTARLLHSISVDGQLVQIIACHECGTEFNPSVGSCPSCQTAVCPQCHIILEEEENHCPRCGMAAPQNTVHHCPTCKGEFTQKQESCPHCDQLLCPHCLTAVSETETSCPQCHAEFELFCHKCGATVSAESDSCPQCHTQFADEA